MILFIITCYFVLCVSGGAIYFIEILLLISSFWIIYNIINTSYGKLQNILLLILRFIYIHQQLLVIVYDKNITKHNFMFVINALCGNVQISNCKHITSLVFPSHTSIGKPSLLSYQNTLHFFRYTIFTLIHINVKIVITINNFK